jgi:phosphate transport system substrate-binding protein
MRLTVFMLGILFQALITQANALEGCFCAKDNPAQRKCGQIERFDPADSVTIREYVDQANSGARVIGAPVTLPFLNFTECAADLSPTRAPEIEDVKIIIGQGEQFGIAGSNTIGEALMPALIKGYGSQHGFRVDGEVCNSTFVLGSGSGKGNLSIRCESKGTHTGIPTLARGEADIAMLSRPIDDEEQAMLARVGLDRMTSVRHESVIALDGLRIVVAPANRVRALSLDQVARIFAGQISDWADVGGTPGRISLYARDTKSGTRDTFETLVMEPLGLSVSPSARQFESSTELVEGVAADPAAIGFVGFAYTGGTKSLNIVEECGITHSPSVLSIKTEDYPLARRLYLYTARLTSVHSQNLISYALSERSQPVIARAGYVNQAIEMAARDETARRLISYAAAPTRETGLDVDIRRIASMVQDLSASQRLSITFRFRHGSSDLDTKALQDIVRLGRFFQQYRSGGQRLLLAGFADASGSFKTNQQLSQARAEAVRSALIRTGAKLDRAAIETRGYSELLPVSCNDHAAGREKNRRVEVYLVSD